MSIAAEQERTRRQAWAAPGSRHDHLIETLRWALPSAVGMLIALLAVLPLTRGRDISFMLDKHRVAIAHERMRVTRALYRGRDNKGQPFSLMAASAVQVSSRDPVVHLQRLLARIAQPGGPTQIIANQGRYNMTTQRVAIDGPVVLTAAHGYRVTTRDVLVDLTTKTAVSEAPVEGTMTLGTFSGGRLVADLVHHTVVLDHGARLHIARSHAKPAA
jgi:lipopolysaccharide export system protein LptC